MSWRLAFPTRPQLWLLRDHLPESVVLLVASWLVPFLIHLIPWTGARPLGVHLLPAFWTVFIAVYFFGVGVGLLTALVTPVISLLLTGLPALGHVAPMSLELVAFVLAASGLVRLRPKLVFMAPLAYLPAKVFAIGVQWAVPAFHYTRNPLEHFFATIRDVSAGLAVLLLINLLLVRLTIPRHGSAQ